MKITIENFFNKTNEKEFVKIPFVLPENVESFILSYSYDKTVTKNLESGEKEKNLIDLALIDSDGNQVGASCASKEHIFISEHYCTPGYHPQTIKGGKWEVLLGLYKLKTDGVKVKAEIDYKFKSFRWLKGDPHTHTLHSDARKTTSELQLLAKKRKLDWIIITDHNVHHEGTSIPEDKDILTMRGMELTAYAGHLNFFGVTKPFDCGYNFTNFEELLPIVNEAKDRGAMVSINHPCCKNCGWHLSLDAFPFDCMEVWNSIQRVDNINAVQLWSKMLADGKKIAAVGGSDFHRDYVVTKLLGIPTTVVYADSLCENAVLSALKKGASYITSKPNGVKLTISTDGKYMGETIKFTSETEVEIFVDKLKKGHTLTIYNNDKILYEFTSRKTCKYKVKVHVKEAGFVRAEITYTMNKLVEKFYRIGMKFFLPQDSEIVYPPMIEALTNPIYYEI